MDFLGIWNQWRLLSFESLCSEDEEGPSETVEVSSSKSSRERKEMDAFLESYNLLGLR